MNFTSARIILASVLLMCAHSSAGERSVSSYFCVPPNDAVPYTTGNVPNGTGTVTTNASVLLCPLTDDSGQVDRGSAWIMTLGVKVRDTSSTTQMQATACVQYYGVDGVACGNTMSSGNAFVGSTTLSPSAVVWHTYPFDWAYVYVNTCAGCRTYGYRVVQ